MTIIRKRRKYSEGKCNDCGRHRPVTQVAFWATGMKYVVCGQCIKPYYQHVNMPIEAKP
jgi:hypothetical protein